MMLAAAMTRSEKLQLSVLLLASGLLYLAHSLLRFRNFEARGYDLGIFDQAVRQYALLKPPIVPIKGENVHLLGDHFHPIIALLAPLYWIWDDPRMLNIALVVLLVSAAVPVYLVVRGWFGHRPAILSAAAMLLWWPFQAFVDWDFHEIAFGVPIIGWVIWSVERRRPWLAVGLSAVLLLVREDLGVTLVAIAVVLAIRRFWVPAAVTAVLGMVGFWFAVGVVIPHFAADGEFGYWEYTALGSTAAAAVVTLVTRPWTVLPVLVDHPLKIGLLLAHFVPLWLLPLLSPYVLIGLPVLLSRLLNDRLTVWGLVYQYDAILAPVFLLAALDVLRRLGERNGWRFARPVDASGRRTPTWKNPALLLPGGMIFLSVVGGAAMAYTVPQEYQIFPLHRTYAGESWQFDERAEAHRRAVEMIPDGACVEAADTAAPHLVDRAYVGLNGTLDEDHVNWIIIDETEDELGGTHPLTPLEAFERAERLGFETITQDDHGLWVLHRDMPDAPVCEEYLQR